LTFRSSTAPRVSPAREVAFSVLHRVEGGAHASDLLLDRCRNLDPRDAGLASEVVFGALRHQAQLDFLVGHFSGRRPSALDPEVLISLRMGIYQLRYLDRIPSHAAVAESVELVKRARKRSAAGFVNAVLRKAHRDPVAWPDLATELSEPPWLLERWQRQFGEEAAWRIARAFLAPPDTYVRVPGGALPGSVEAEATEIEGCFRILKGDVTGLRIQDMGSQSIVPLLGLAPGQAFLDLCAAPGNKTAQALESGVNAVACDSSPRRLAALQGLRCERVVLDGTQPLPFGCRFDRVLVDAPCSGTGTLARNPEIRWRLKPASLAAHHTRQVALLSRALDVLAPGGRLVYSTCSLEREENEAVVEKVVGRLPDVVLRRIPGAHPGDGFFAAVLGSE